MAGPVETATVRATSVKTGLVEGANDWARTGEHRPGGLLAATGAGIAAARLDDVDLLDVAPTILHLLEVGAGELDGKPLPSLTGRVALRAASTPRG